MRARGSRGGSSASSICPPSWAVRPAPKVARARQGDARTETSMASTVIGAGITIEGEIATDEDVVVAGTGRGELSAKEAVANEPGAAAAAHRTGASVVVA